MSRFRQQPKRTQGDKIRESFYKLALDWIDLHTRLPRPAARADHRTRRSTREYGHPAEWASDKTAQIASLFWSWHDMLAEHRNEHRPPEHTSEAIRVVNAWRYLEPRFDQLCDLVETEAFREIADLHYGIQRSLGRSNPPVILPVPCPHEECGLRTLERRIAVGRDLIICGNCGYTVREEHYPFLVRMVLDELIEAA